MLQTSKTTITKLVLIFFFGLTYFTASQAQNMQAAVAPNAVIIDVDRFLKLSNDMCVVEKGDKQALIDTNGSFLIPWGKYKYTTEGTEFYGGIVRVSDPITKRLGYVDRRGVEFIPIVRNPFDNSMDANAIRNRLLILGYALNKNPPKNIDLTLPTSYSLVYPDVENGYYINAINSTNRFLVTYVDPQNKMKLGYINKHGKIVISPTFELAQPFSENMAAVAKKDDFGNWKWGYIDTTGKLVIPYKYSIRPGPFHNGLAMVQPQQNISYTHGYINKHDSLVIKVVQEKSFDHMQLPLGLDLARSSSGGYNYTNERLGVFFQGYSIWGENGSSYAAHLMDTTGQFLLYSDLFHRLGYNAPGYVYSMYSFCDKGIIALISPEGHATKAKIGMISFSGRLLFPFIFSQLTPDNLGDFAVATILIEGMDPTISSSYQEGLVNKNGVFKVIKSNKQKIW